MLDNLNNSQLPIRTLDEWEQLIQGEVLKQRQETKEFKDATEYINGLSKDQWHNLRYLCKTDLFFLTHTILNYNRLSENLHGNLCAWESETRKNYRFRLILLPRGHFKSTIITIAHSIQIALPDVTNSSLWPMNLGPNVRILIAHAVADKAGDYLYEITQHFMTNPWLMGLFPDCVPSPKKQRINKSELELPRTQVWKEATFDTMGVGGKSQGAHYNYIKLDDIVGDKERDSETEMAKNKDWIDNIQAFFSLFKQDRLDCVGTRWSDDDTYAHMMDRYGKTLAVYKRSVEEINPVTNSLEPVFPEEFDAESLNILRKNKKVFNAQYLNDPDRGATEFDSSWIKYYFWQGHNTIAVFGSGDVSGNQKRVLNIRNLRINFLVDPADTGDSGFAITGTDWNNNTYILEAHQHDWTPPEFTNLIFNKVVRYQPATVAIEQELFSALYEHWYKAEMRLRNIRFHITMVHTKKIAKEARVRGLSNYLSGGQLYFNETFYSRNLEKTDSDLIYQIKKFGTIKEYHVLDALGYGPEVWMPAANPEMFRQQQEQGNNRIVNARSITTGYSQIFP